MSQKQQQLTEIVQTDEETKSEEVMGKHNIRKASIDDATFPTLPHQSQTQEPERDGSQEQQQSPLSMRKSTMAEYDVINQLLNDSSPMAAKDITAPGSKELGHLTKLNLDSDRQRERERQTISPIDQYSLAERTPQTKSQKRRREKSPANLRKQKPELYNTLNVQNMDLSEAYLSPKPFVKQFGVKKSLIKKNVPMMKAKQNKQQSEMNQTSIVSQNQAKFAHIYQTKKDYTNFARKISFGVQHCGSKLTAQYSNYQSNNASSHFQTREEGLQESPVVGQRGDAIHLQIPQLDEAMIADSRKAANQAVVLSKSHLTSQITYTHPMSAVISEGQLEKSFEADKALDSAENQNKDGAKDSQIAHEEEELQENFILPINMSQSMEQPSIEVTLKTTPQVSPRRKNDNSRRSTLKKPDKNALMKNKKPMQIGHPMFSNGLSAQETMDMGIDNILDQSMLPEVTGTNTIISDDQMDECVNEVNANNDSSVTNNDNQQSYDEGEQDFSKFTLKGANFGKKRKARNVSMQHATTGFPSKPINEIMKQRFAQNMMNMQKVHSKYRSIMDYRLKRHFAQPQTKMTDKIIRNHQQTNLCIKVPSQTTEQYQNLHSNDKPQSTFMFSYPQTSPFKSPPKVIESDSGFKHKSPISRHKHNAIRISKSNIMSNSYHEENFKDVIKKEKENIQELVDLNDNLANESISLDVWNVNMDSKKVGPTNSRSSSKGELVMTTQQNLETIPTKIEDLSSSPRHKDGFKDLNQNSMVVIASQKSIIQEHQESPKPLLQTNDCSARTHLKPTDTSNTSKLILNQKPVMISNFQQLNSGDLKPYRPINRIDQMYKSLQNNNYSYKFLSTLQHDQIKKLNEMKNVTQREKDQFSQSRQSTQGNRITTTKTLTFNEIFSFQKKSVETKVTEVPGTGMMQGSPRIVYRDSLKPKKTPLVNDYLQSPLHIRQAGSVAPVPGNLIPMLNLQNQNQSIRYQQEKFFSPTGSEYASNILSPIENLANKSTGFNEIFIKRKYGKINSMDLNFGEFQEILTTKNAERSTKNYPLLNESKQTINQSRQYQTQQRGSLPEGHTNSKFEIFPKNHRKAMKQPRLTANLQDSTNLNLDIGMLENKKNKMSGIEDGDITNILLLPAKGSANTIPIPSMPTKQSQHMVTNNITQESSNSKSKRHIREVSSKLIINETQHFNIGFLDQSLSFENTNKGVGLVLANLNHDSQSNEDLVHDQQIKINAVCQPKATKLSIIPSVVVTEPVSPDMREISTGPDAVKPKSPSIFQNQTVDIKTSELNIPEIYQYQLEQYRLKNELKMSPPKDNLREQLECFCKFQHLDLTQRQPFKMRKKEQFFKDIYSLGKTRNSLSPRMNPNTQKQLRKSQMVQFGRIQVSDLDYKQFQNEHMRQSVAVQTNNAAKKEFVKFENQFIANMNNAFQERRSMN